MVRKESARKLTGKGQSANAPEPVSLMTIPFTVNPTQPHLWKMKFLPDRGYDMSNAHPNFQATVEALQWEKFVEHREFYLEQVVREFYAGMTKKSGAVSSSHSIVRGKRVMYDEATINTHYNLRFTGTTFNDKYDNYGKTKMEEIKNRVAIPDCDWDKCSHNEFKLKIKYIIPECNWQTFINCSIMPTSHNYTLSKDRLIILDCILSDEKINIGRIINEEIRECVKKTEGNLFFPCLITELCMNQGVEVSENELNHKKYPPSALSAEMKPRRISKSQDMPKKKKIEEKVEEDRNEKKDDAIRRFLLDQHEWIKKKFAEIFGTTSDSDCPEFPLWIFEDSETQKKNEMSVEEEPVKKKKKVLKRKKETKRKDKGKKKKTEEEWIDIEETDEEEEDEFKRNEKETSEEEDTATDGSGKKDSFDDWNLDMTMEEYLRKKKGKNPVIEQVQPPNQSPKIPTPPATPITTTTPPPPTKPDVIQRENEPENPPNQPTQPTDQPSDQPSEQTRANTPPIPEETPIISSNIASETTVLQVPIEARRAATKAALDAAKARLTEAVNMTPEELDETWKQVVNILEQQKREEALGEASEMMGGDTAKEAVIVEAQPEIITASTGEEPIEKDVEKETDDEPDSTEKDVAKVLQDLTEKVLEDTAEVTKATDKLSGATAPGAIAPGATAPENTPATAKLTRTAALKEDATASKSGSKGGKKKQRPTPTRQSNRLKSGVHHQ